MGIVRCTRRIAEDGPGVGLPLLIISDYSARGRSALPSIGLPRQAPIEVHRAAIAQGRVTSEVAIERQPVSDFVHRLTSLTSRCFFGAI